MLHTVIALCLLSLVSAQTPDLGACPDVKAQETLNVTQYLGTWYEIYKFSNIFEAGKCNRAVYTLKDDGHINVENRDIQNGQVSTATGDGYIPDMSEPAKLKVRFYPGTPAANYWVVNTDYHQFTLIYSCSAVAGLAHVETAWIMARNMTISEEVTTKLMQQLASYKIDVSKFTKTDQSNCPK